MNSDLAKVLILIRILTKTGFSAEPEAVKMKEYIFRNPNQAKSLVAKFTKMQSLDAFKENFRGAMGMPRTREADSGRNSFANVAKL